MKFFEHLDKKGGFYYERWGDAPVHSIGAALFAKKEQIVSVYVCLSGLCLSARSMFVCAYICSPTRIFVRLRVYLVACAHIYLPPRILVRLRVPIRLCMPKNTDHLPL